MDYLGHYTIERESRDSQVQEHIGGEAHVIWPPQSLSGSALGRDHVQD